MTLLQCLFGMLIFKNHANFTELGMPQLLNTFIKRLNDSLEKPTKKICQINLIFA
jgi:hypothetical protein